MEVRLGVIYSPKELVVEIDQSPEELTGQIEKAIGATKGALLWLTDSKGRRIGVPADKLAYVEVGPEDGSNKRVGFGL
jgi:hypothetical protein